MSDGKISRRTWMCVRVMEETLCSLSMAMEAVASTAIEHPEWDMDERKTWKEWESYGDEG